jgi:hypothetical protein
VDNPADALRVDADKHSAALSAAAFRPQPAQAASGTPAGDVPDQPTVQQFAATTVDTLSVQQTRSVVSQTALVVAAAQVETPTTASSPVSRVVAQTLAWAGLSGSLTDSPVAPVESPALLAVLAGWRRQSKQALTDEGPTDLADLAHQTGQTVDPMVTDDQPVADTSTMRVPVSLATAADTTPPTVSVTAPADGATVSGLVTLTATASDNVGVAGVQFLVNGGPVGAEDTGSPYSLSALTTAANNGTYLVTARARDTAGNTTTSVPVTIIVDNTAPTVSLTAPADGATVSGLVTLTATASDNVAVAGVQFLANGVPVGAEDTGSPYSLSAPTTAANNGTYTLTAVARDAAGNTTTSAPVTITVNTPPAVTVVGNLTLSGWPTGKPQLMSADGTRALVTTYPPPVLFGTTLATVINTITGTQIGAVSVPGALSSSLLSANGSRALITATPNGVDGKLSNNTRVAVVNTSTGTQIGTTLSLTGNPSGSLMSADGTRALIATSNYDPLNFATNVTTWVTVVNTTTGIQMGTIFNVPGNTIALQPLNADGTRALLTTRVYNPTSSTYSTRVAVLNTTGAQTGTTLTIDLDQFGFPLVNANGTRAVLDTNRVVVIDTTTGRQIGSTFTPFPADSLSFRTQLTADGTRAVITTNSIDAGGTVTATRVAVVNLNTGTQSGTTVTIPRGIPGGGGAVLSSDGTRAVIMGYNTDAATTTTSVAVIDTANGAQIGNTVTFTYPGYGESATQLVSSTAKRAVITTSSYNPAIVDDVTRVVVIDTSTGSQIGTAVAVTGDASASLQVTADGSRALITTRSYAVETGIYTTRAAVIDTITGTQIGNTVTLSGEQFSSPLLNADRTRVLITTQFYNPATGNYDRWVTEIDPSTGNQIGTALPWTKDPQYTLLSADGTRALNVTSVFPGDGTTRVEVLRIG